MLKLCSMTILHKGAKYFSTTGSKNLKVCVIGAAGGIGQPLSLLLKQNSAISELSMYDVVKHTHGVAADVSHMDFPAKVTSFIGPEHLKDALKDAAAVVIPAGIPRKPGMTRDDLFSSNARLVRDIAIAVSEACPKALVTIITNPVNSVVPIFCETMNKSGKLDPCRVFGCTALDLVRSAKFIGELKNLDPTKVKIPCIGGHSGDTIIPLISQCKPSVQFPPDELAKLTKRIQVAGSEVVKAKVGTGSATLSMAHAGSRFVNNLIKGLKGESGVVDCAYVMSEVAGTKYFSTPLELGKNGVQKNLGMGSLNDFEKGLLKKAVPEIQKNVAKGEKFVR